MKVVKFTLVLFAVHFWLFSASCKKDDGLTKITSIGANTFSCKVNGRNFFPKQDLFGPKPIVVSVSKSQGSGSLYLSAHQYDHYLQTMSFHVDNFKGVGTYYFKEPVITTSSSGAKIYNSPDVYLEAHLAYPNTGSFFAKDGQLIISRYDSGILSGTFEYSLLNGTEIVYVTKGRFDLKL